MTSSPSYSPARRAGRRLAQVMMALVAEIRPGMPTRELDEIAYRLILKGGDRPAFLNYRPPGSRHRYPASLCVSLNSEVVHGLPGRRVIAAGDVVSLDLGLEHQGWFADMAVTAGAGRIDSQAERLIAATVQALARGIAAVRAGGFVGDVGAAIEAAARKRKLGLVRALGGHGVGKRLHQDPEVPNFGPSGQGARLESGMILAVEPMLTLGGGEVKFLPDGFTVETTDGSLAAHFEHTVLVTDRGPEILTKV